MTERPPLNQQLLDAANRGELALCHTLVSYGARVDVEDELGNTALHWACTYGTISKNIELFFEPFRLSPTDFSKKNRAGLSPFLCAAKAGNLDILRYLCLLYPDLLIYEEDNQGNNVLHLAILSGNEESVRFLLSTMDYSILKDLDNDDDKTPKEMAEQLLEESRGDPETQLYAEALRNIITLFSEKTIVAKPSKNQRSTPAEQSHLFHRPSTNAGRRRPGPEQRSGTQRVSFAPSGYE